MNALHIIFALSIGLNVVLFFAYLIVRKEEKVRSIPKSNTPPQIYMWDFEQERYMWKEATPENMDICNRTYFDMNDGMRHKLRKNP